MEMRASQRIDTYVGIRHVCAKDVDLWACDVP